MDATPSSMDIEISDALRLSVTDFLAQCKVTDSRWSSTIDTFTQTILPPLTSLTKLKEALSQLANEVESTTHRFVPALRNLLNSRPALTDTIREFIQKNIDPQLAPAAAEPPKQMATAEPEPAGSALTPPPNLATADTATPATAGGIPAAVEAAAAQNEDALSEAELVTAEEVAASAVAASARARSPLSIAVPLNPPAVGLNTEFTQYEPGSVQPQFKETSATEALIEAQRTIESLNATIAEQALRQEAERKELQETAAAVKAEFVQQLADKDSQIAALRAELQKAQEDLRRQPALVPLQQHRAREAAWGSALCMPPVGGWGLTAPAGSSPVDGGVQSRRKVKTTS